MSANPKTKSLRWYFLGVGSVALLVTLFVVIFFPPCFFYSIARKADKVTTTVLLVRHAEKNTNAEYDTHDQDRPLCQPGTDRAQELAHVAGRAGVNVIYHTEFDRTRLTIEPLDAVVSDNVTHQYAARDLDALVSDIRLDVGKVIVVAGHGDTVPSIIEKLGVKTQLDGLDDTGHIPNNEYDNLYVVTLTCSCGTKVAHLKYGRPSPLTEDEEADCARLPN
jgi:phosphohistidine phosphatase SixA